MRDEPDPNASYTSASGNAMHPLAQDIAERPVTDNAPHLEGAIWFRSGQRQWGKARHMALLAAIGTQGSIAAAAKTTGLSYKAAWDAVDVMNNLAGESLVLRTTGGLHGGGARLTPRAHQLLRLYECLHREHTRFMAHLAAVSAEQDQNLEWIEHMMLQVSIRNRLTASVVAVRAHGVRADVTLQLGKQSIIASITRDSARYLGLVPGKRALALIKASSVMVTRPDARKPRSTHNQLAGHIHRIERDTANAEVHITLENGYTMVATLSRTKFDTLSARTGDHALATFAATQVMLGVLD